MKAIKLVVATLSLSLASWALAGGDLEKGKNLVEKANCAECHGKDYNTPKDNLTPRLAGQHADYLEHALLAYKRGSNGANGRGNATMVQKVGELSKDDFKHIAAYLSSLQGSLVLKK